MIVNLDGAQMGVGGDDSWGALPHDEFRLFPGNYTFQLRTVRQEAGVRAGLFSSQKR